MESLISLSQVCQQLRRDLCHNYLPHVIQTKHPLLLVAMPYQANSHHLAVVQRFREREHVVEVAPHGTKPVTVTYLRVFRDTGFPLGSQFIGLQWDGFPHEYQPKPGVIHTRKWTELLSAVTRLTNYSNGIVRSRYGLQATADEADTIHAATPDVLAIMRQSSPPAKLHVTYKREENNTSSHIAFMDGNQCESYALYALGEDVVLRIISGISEDNLRERFIHYRRGVASELFSRPYHPAPDYLDLLDFIIWEGYIWEISRDIKRSRITIQTLKPSNQPKIIVPYQYDMADTSSALQDRFHPQYVLLFSHNQSRYLVDMQLKKVYSWRTRVEDRTLIIKAGDELYAHVFSSEIGEMMKTDTEMTHN